MRFPEFTGEWEKCTIDELFELRNGYTPSKANHSFWDGGTIPWFRMEDIRQNGGVLSDAIQHITPEAVKGSGLFEPYSIILATTATIGEHAMLIADSLANQRFTNLKVRKSLADRYDPYYLYYYFFRIDKWCLKNTNAGGLLSVDIPSLKRKRIYAPLLEEQRKISKLLSAIDERIATQNKIIEDLKKLKSAIRKKVYSQIKDEHTESFEINQLLDYEQPTVYIVANNEYSTDTNLTPVLTANKGFVLGYTDETFGIYHKGDCIIFDDFTMDAKYVSFPFKVKSSAIKILTAKNNVNLRFMFEYLSYLDLKSEEHKRHYISEITSHVIELPLKERQDKIASLLTSLDNKLALEEKAKSKYEDEKQYLLSQMFI